MISNEMRDKLIAMARDASQNAYVPYSHFKVGAAILGEGGGIFTGCNVENASQLSGDLPVPIPQLCRERLTCPKKRPGRGFLGRVFIRLRCHPQCGRMS